MSELSDRLRRIAEHNRNARHEYDVLPTEEELDEAADELDRLTKELDAEREIVKGLVRQISEIYQIADGPSRDVRGNEVEAVRELRRERDVLQSLVDMAVETERLREENAALRAAKKARPQ